ncbi:MAG: hypothetical protein ACXVCY_03745 [Pseudobdellovibrionaceae bacterium]
MKTIIVVLLLCSNAFAGGLKEVAIMATESVEENLFLNDGDHSYQITSQDLATPEENANFAIETKVTIRSIHSGRTENWTCLTQFIKTAEFFKVSKTDCKK